MLVYRVKFVLAGNEASHTTYIHAANAREAIRKLADRFPREPHEIHIESVDEDHGRFIVGSEERDFSG